MAHPKKETFKANLTVPISSFKNIFSFWRLTWFMEKNPQVFASVPMRGLDSTVKKCYDVSTPCLEYRILGISTISGTRYRSCRSNIVGFLGVRLIVRMFDVSFTSSMILVVLLVVMLLRHFLQDTVEFSGYSRELFMYMHTGR